MPMKALKCQFCGLWSCANGKYYISPNIRKGEFDELFKNSNPIAGVRVIMRKNPYKKNDSHPSFQFSFIAGKEGTDLKEEGLPKASFRKKEKYEVVTVDDAVEIAIDLLRDLEYGYSMDDLQVEARRFMEERSFDAYESED